MFGFIGNFFFAYVPYKLWQNLGLISPDDSEPNPKTGKKILAFCISAIAGLAACSLLIAWGLDLLKMVPFAALATIISLNNSIPSVVLGLPLLLVLYPRIKKWDLLWTDIMKKEDVPQRGTIASLGAYLMVAGIIIGLVGGLAVALGIGQALFAAGFAAGGAGTLKVGIIAGIGSLLVIISGFMQ